MTVKIFYIQDLLHVRVCVHFLYKVYIKSQQFIYSDNANKTVITESWYIWIQHFFNKTENYMYVNFKLFHKFTVFCIIYNTIHS